MSRRWTRLWTSQLLLNPPDVVQLPAAILEIVLDTPSSVLGLSYRRYIKTAFLPGIRRVVELLRAHSATIEVGDTTEDGCATIMHLRLLDSTASKLLNLSVVVGYSGRRWPGCKKSTQRDLASSVQIRTLCTGFPTHALGTLCWLRGPRMTSPACGLECHRRHWHPFIHLRPSSSHVGMFQEDRAPCLFLLARVSAD